MLFYIFWVVYHHHSILFALDDNLTSKIECENMARTSTECSSCHYPLEENYSGPCPRCGDTKKNINLELEVIVQSDVSLSITIWEQYKGYWTKNRVWQCLIICIIFITAILDFYFGYLGLAIGLGFIIFLSLSLFTHVLFSNDKFKEWFLSFFEYKTIKK